MGKFTRVGTLAIACLLLGAHWSAADTSPGEVTQDTSLGEAVVASVLRALRLPEAVEEARSVGIPEEQIREVLVHARQQGVAAEHTEVVFSEGTRQVREGASPKNFGQSVKAMIADGLRGRDLAAAIHASKGVGKAAVERASAAGKSRKAVDEKGAQGKKTKANGGGGK